MPDFSTKWPRCSVIITAYNAAGDLPHCLSALLNQDYPNAEIILIDNASTDDTPQVVAPYAGRIRYVRLAENRAVTGGYNAGAAIAAGSVLVFINADTIAQPGWLQGLVEPLLDDAAIGMTTSRIVLHDQPERINTCGNAITWTGLTICRGLNEPVDDWSAAGDVAAGSGASLAIRRDLFEQIGGFDDTFQFYWDDTDLSLRVWLHGYRVWYAPASRIGHRYTFSFGAGKAYYIERNRWLTMFKTFRLPTLLLLLSGLLLGEAMAWVYVLLQGKAHVQAKARGWQWLWANRRTVATLHRETQALRRVPDRVLLRTWSPRLRFIGAVPDRVAGQMERIVQPILSGYGRLCRGLAAW